MTVEQIRKKYCGERGLNVIGVTYDEQKDYIDYLEASLSKISSTWVKDGNPKITKADVIAIRCANIDGTSNKHLAEKYCISYSQIVRIVSYKTWVGHSSIDKQVELYRRTKNGENMENVARELGLKRITQNR
jgi:hypothetical protein